MARRKIDQQLYDSLLKAYRIKPENHAHAAKFGGCDRRMAKRAWEKGWDHSPWATPIEQVLKEEQLAARAEMAKRVETDYDKVVEEREKAFAEAVKTRAQEGELVKMSRATAINVLAKGIKLLQTGSILVETIEESLKDMQQAADRGEEMPMHPLQAIRLLRQVAGFVNQGVSVGDAAMRLERLRLGEPEQILGIQDADMSVEDALAEIREAEAARKRYERSHLKLVGQDSGE